MVYTGFARSGNHYRFITGHNGSRNMACFLLDCSEHSGLCDDQIWMEVMLFINLSDYKV